MRRGALTLIAAVLLGLGDCVSQAGCTTRTASPLATGAEALGPAPAYHVSRLSLMDPVAKWQERGLGSLRAPLRGGTAIEDEVKFQDVTGDGGVLKLILREVRCQTAVQALLNRDATERDVLIVAGCW